MSARSSAAPVGCAAETARGRPRRAAPVVEAPPWRSMAAAPRRGRGLGVTVLLVEDEHNIGALVRTYLEREGHSVVWARSGEEALAELTRHPVRMVVLDIGLPGIDGFEVLRRVRAGSSVPVIMLTARDEEADRVVGLELGADDYVPKPFSPRELVARVKAVLRRTEGAARREMLFLGDVAVDLKAREAAVAGARVDLTLKEFDLLACFLEHRRRRPLARASARACLGPRVPRRHADGRPARRATARQARRRRDDRDGSRHRLQGGAIDDAQASHPQRFALASRPSLLRGAHRRHDSRGGRRRLACVLRRGNDGGSSGADYSAEVYRRWALEPNYVDPLSVGVDAGLLRLKKSGRLRDRDFFILAQRVQALTDATGDSGRYDYMQARITAADAAAYRESRQTVFGAGIYAALGDDQVVQLREQGYYWGPGTYWYQELQPGGDPEQEHEWVWNSTTVPTVAWMTGKDRVAWVQVMPPEANAGWQDSWHGGMRCCSSWAWLRWRDWVCWPRCSPCGA